MLCNSHHCLIRHLRRPIRSGSSDPSSLITIVTGPYATQRRSRLGTSIPFVWSLLFQALLGWTEQRTISEVGRGNFFFLISLYCHEMSREVISRLCFDIHPPLGCLINHNVHAKPSSHSSPPSFVVLPFFSFALFFLLHACPDPIPHPKKSLRSRCNTQGSRHIAVTSTFNALLSPGNHSCRRQANLLAHRQLLSAHYVQSKALLEESGSPAELAADHS